MWIDDSDAERDKRIMMMQRLQNASGDGSPQLSSGRQRHFAGGRRRIVRIRLPLEPKTQPLLPCFQAAFFAEQAQGGPPQDFLRMSLGNFPNSDGKLCICC